MAGTDIVHLYDEHYAVRDVADAWRTAGSPPINSAGRLYAEQKKAWDAYQNGTGSPADNPDRPDKFPLGHVRFAALDIDATPERVRRLTAAGLTRPFDHESWHWAAPDVYAYPIVTALPTPDPEPAGGFLMALSTTQQDDIYMRVEAIADAVGVIKKDVDETQDRVRGGEPKVDILQDILGQIKALRAEVTQLTEGSSKS